jgi:predicted RND superfamily exporter protein
VLVCAGATLLGFGSLAFISVPAVRSLGIVVIVGMVAALFSAFFLLAPILLMPPKPQPTPRLESVIEPVEIDASH